MAKKSKRRHQQRAPAPYDVMTDDLKRQIRSQFSDDVLSKLVEALFEVIDRENWTKRDIAQITGMHESVVSRVLSGQRKNLEIETIALLARAMKRRPELLLHDARPTGNQAPVAMKAADWGLSAQNATLMIKEPSFEQSY